MQSTSECRRLELPDWWTTVKPLRPKPKAWGLLRWYSTPGCTLLLLPNNSWVDWCSARHSFDEVSCFRTLRSDDKKKQLHLRQNRRTSNEFLLKQFASSPPSTYKITPQYKFVQTWQSAGNTETHILVPSISDTLSHQQMYVPDRCDLPDAHFSYFQAISLFHRSLQQL